MDANSENGVLSKSLSEVQRSNFVFSKSTHSTTKVQLRSPRDKLVSRPISMPVERLLNPVLVNERNSRNAMETERNPAIQEVTEPEKPSARVSTYYRNTYIDTHTLRRTWDKQYKHYDITPRTAMIMAKVPSEGGSGGSATLSASLPASYTSNTTSTIFANKPYTVAVRPGRTLKRDENGGESDPTSRVFRASRTLQPPPGTFYKPPQSVRTKQPEEAGAKACDAAATAPQQTEEGMEDPADASPATSPQPQSVGSSPEELSQSEAKPVYQRLRPRRLQEYEHREAHFV